MPTESACASGGRHCECAKIAAIEAKYWLEVRWRAAEPAEVESIAMGAMSAAANIYIAISGHLTAAEYAKEVALRRTAL